MSDGNQVKALEGLLDELVKQRQQIVLGNDADRAEQLQKIQGTIEAIKLAIKDEQGNSSSRGRSWVL